jgi:hypothetical protein
MPVKCGDRAVENFGIGCGAAGGHRPVSIGFSVVFPSQPASSSLRDLHGEKIVKILGMSA